MRHNPWISAFALLCVTFSASAQATDERREPFGNYSWLGVQLTPVPAALAAHLETDNAGLMVRNVFKNSPADEAGIKQFDVIAEADGKRVAPDVRLFSEHIHSKAPGQELELKLYRRAKVLALTLHLTPRPADARLELKYSDDPDVVHRKNFGMRGRILRPGPDGWVMEDLGELPEADWLPSLRRGEANEARRVDKNGRVLHVRRLKDGTIEVRRYLPAEGVEKGELRVYGNADQLREADADAADLLSSARESEKWELRIPDESARPHWQEWRDRFFQGPLRDSGPRSRKPEKLEPKLRFEVQPNGEIRAKSRHDDAELEMTFQSREDFKNRAPELYERFEAMEKDLR